MGRKSKREIEVGEKIGVVTVTGRVYNEARAEWEYVCRCRCGSEFKTRKDHLLKPRQGCRACINKVKADLDLAGTISEEEFNKRLEAKNFEKMQKKAVAEEKRKERVAEIERRRKAKQEEHERMLQKFKDSKLVSPIWVGQKFGRLTVIDTYVDSAKTYWICKCDCGNIVSKLAKLVKYGYSRSCGCLSKDILEHRKQNAKTHERLYGIWQGMKDRCNNPNNTNYHNYGGRGITICEKWQKSYRDFRDWAYRNGWTEDIPDNHQDALSIERINVNGNYCPENCCFIPLRCQCLNKRPYNERNKIITKKDKNMITIGFETKSEREWQNFYGVSNAMLAYRIKKLGMPIEKALSEPKYEWLKKKS